jgi:sterol desaturase/sphingolipid hydroxylase (fatty acid hydroxylase superfamily)
VQPWLGSYGELSSLGALSNAQMHRVVPLLIAYIVLAVVFGTLERLAPAIPGQPRWRPDAKTDLAYWLFTPLVTRALAQAAVIVAVSALAITIGHARDKAGIQAFALHHTVLASQPRALQLVELLFVADLVGYWVHRLFHGRRLWPYHAVHHSSEQLDWLSAVRVHPINDVLAKLAVVLPLIPFGFDLTVTLSVAPVLALYAVFIHANVRWDFGPLRWVIATPAFHRWHHTSEAFGLDKNFAGFFPVFDLVFGTFFMPKGQHAQRFGVPGLEMPPGILGQLAYPLRRRQASAR